MKNHLEILRMSAVLKYTGLSRTTLWRRIRSGDFPVAIRLGGTGTRSVGWHANEIEDWLASRPRATGEHSETNESQPV